MENEKTVVQIALEKAITEAEAKGQLPDEFRFKDGQLVRAHIKYAAHVLDIKKSKDRESDVELEYTTDPFEWKEGKSNRDWQDYRFLTDMLAPMAINDWTLRVRYTYVIDVRYEEV